MTISVMMSTNITQSERLLEAGLRRESADMQWNYDRHEDRYYLNVAHEDSQLFADYPSWSLPKLWDIMLRSGVIYEYSTCESSEKVLNSLVDAVARLAKQGRIK